MKKRKIFIISLAVVFFISIFSWWFFRPYNQFPVIAFTKDSERPMIFYLSGDAGFNTFSKSIGKHFNKLGYDTYVLDTKKYFWQGRNPDETARDVDRFLKETLNERKDQKLYLVGFSYGSDVLPFVYNRLDPEIKSKVQKLVMIGPSKHNDFKIHLEDYLGVTRDEGYPVIPEINKVGNIPLLLMLSDYEFVHFPYQQITLGQNYKMLHLHGDHHYGGNTTLVTQTVANYLQQK